MTTLEKAVHRKTRGAYSVLYVRPRQIVVSLLPGDLIQFREAGGRKRYTVPVDGVFKHAVRLQLLQTQAEKRKAKIRRKRGVA